MKKTPMPEEGNKISIRIPEFAGWVIRHLTAAGYEAYVVGGCVRDTILGKTPGDWDITTSALPSEVKAVFKRTIDTGIEHGTVTVLSKGQPVEVTTYRIDGKYEDGRHPTEVTFTPSLEEDLKRRDFTINAMAYNDETGLVDLFGGLEDLRSGIIRAVGDPKERFSEDALRMMRAVRFAGQLGFDIEAQTLGAIKELADNLEKISAERIQTELVKLMVSPYPERFRAMYETGLTKIFLPEFDTAMATHQNNPHHFLSVGEHILLSMKNAPCDKVIRLSMLFHDLGKPEMKTTDENGVDHFHGHPERSAKIAAKRLKLLKFDNATIDDVTILAEYHDVRISPDEKHVRRILSKLGEKRFRMLIDMQRADVLAQSEHLREKKLSGIDEVGRIFEQIIEKGQCVCLRDLAIGGSELISAGYPRGPLIGRELARLLDIVIEEPEKNDADKLMEIARNDLGEGGIAFLHEK